ncbi:MAG: metalloregulator ArsR/SmtB family transcription factor [Euryarchaeota archaeon]|nr:metalloregulator ArsR/SmtB family transcription factor [Euryarchaeota archaeon]MBV1730416.1 metalloregulator ArsR/SmtB family transcription factor [Methanobacterium sp.]MBU4547791.1 metalloregulator ArsR/SmtB family transcription factor [Euryarchaeota archaeon]MBU4607687.1 metalloregulator ArsR/SmtB family transcription factor [Euryarchaeota archaeon]MBV1755070.1 metalloregulator ArsR/SmtB family transcription factor [Methanobacterium sp.]
MPELDKEDKYCLEKNRSSHLNREIPPQIILENLSESFKALSDPTRLKIIYLLEGGELCVCELIMALDKPQSTLSHHLNVLKNAGFIAGRKEGLWIHYKLKNPQIMSIINQLREITPQGD